MEKQVFSKLDQSGGYSLPVLIKLKHPDLISWYFTDNFEDIEHNGNLYKSVPMSYKKPSSSNGIPQGGTIEIDSDINNNGYELLKWFDEADDLAEIEVIGLLNEMGTITELAQFKHRYGKASWDGRKITWNAGGEDRLQMQVNPWQIDADVLTG